MRQNRMTILAALIGVSVGASLLLSSPAAARPAGDWSGTPRVSGPCVLTRSDGEKIQDFSIRIIQCAADRWPVPGGAEKAICIAKRESGLIPTASSATGLYLGLFQHSAAAWPDRYDEWTQPVWELKRTALNGRTNAIVTIRIVNAEGWGPWSGVGC
jgi:hypothetical protein